MYGYLDESGAPGTANNSNDFLIASLVVFLDQKSAKKCSESIDRLRKRLKLREDYEFHRSHNSKTTQAAFIQLLSGLNFKFITVAIKKNQRHDHASYNRLAKLLIREIAANFSKGKIRLDSNPIFLAKLKYHAKTAKLRNIKFSQAKSHKDNLLQMADYVVALSSHKVRNTVNSAENYRSIAKKQLVFVEVRA